MIQQFATTGLFFMHMQKNYGNYNLLKALKNYEGESY